MTAWEVLNGEVLDRLRELPSDSFDGLLSDVPYGLGNREPGAEEIAAYVLGEAGIDMGGDFMSKDWEIPSVAVWREVYRVLKPGAHLLVFAGARTQDLVTIGMRAAGFEIRDCIDWLYISGFPKGLDASKAIDRANGDPREVIGPDPQAARRNKATSKFGTTYGQIDDSESVPVTAPGSAASAPWSGYGTALKPSREPVVLARKPPEGTIAANVQKYGTGALAIDACRVGYASTSDRASMAERVDAIRERGGTMGHPWKNSSDLSGANPASPLGRWPANTIVSHARFEWLALRDDVSVETENAIFAYYGVDQAMRALRRAHSWYAVRYCAPQVLREGLRWSVSCGSADGGMGYCSLQTVPETVRSDASMDTQRSSEVLLQDVSRACERGGEEAWKAPLGQVAEVDVGRSNREVPEGEVFTVEGRQICEPRIYPCDDRCLTGAESIFGTEDGASRKVHSRTSGRGRGDTGSSAKDGRDCPPREWSEGRQSSRESVCCEQTRSFDTAQDARKGTVRNARKGAGVRGGTPRIEVADWLIPTGWMKFFRVVAHGGCSPTGSRKVKTGTAKRSKSDANGEESVEAWRCVDGCPIKLLDEQSGDCPGMSGGGIDSSATARGDSGGASRVFYCAKASRAEREFGCDGLPARSGAEAVDRDADTAGVNNPRAGAGRTAVEVRNHGPCVKPISLTKYLATLILPPQHCAPRRLLVPYCGTGSEIIGAIRAGWEVVTGIERDPEYAPIARSRIARWLEVNPDLDESEAVTVANSNAVDDRQSSLFGGRRG